MMTTSRPGDPTYLNPVYSHASPDPFVLKYCGEYWCYFTGVMSDDRCFGILHSRNLVQWEEVGSAMDALPGGHTCYWAPEVVYENGRFYMYYSVGDEENMQIRVSIASQPRGPFADSGHALTTEKFAIDAHVFADDDGSRYLFYATDFLDYQRIGTGIVCDRLLDPFTLEGRPRPVTRARYDWQVYDPKRANKGGVRWHTVEGPFVLKRHGRYYEMFSGGNWQNHTYGVSYAVTDNLASPGEWEQVSDGERVLPILRSRPDLGIIGPGHNSVVRGPDNCELYCVYHRWQPETQERVLAIDRMGWDGERLYVDGPSTTPQPAPARPIIAGFGRFQRRGGAWNVTDGEAVLSPHQGGAGKALLALPGGDFVLELSLAVIGDAEEGAVMIGLSASGIESASWTMYLNGGQCAIGADPGQTRGLPPGFDPYAFHLLRLEVRQGEAEFTLDHRSVFGERKQITGPCEELRFSVRGLSVSLRGFALTRVTG